MRTSDSHVVRASAYKVIDLGFESDQAKPFDSKIVPTLQLSCSTLCSEYQCEKHAGKFTCCVVGKGTLWKYGSYCTNRLQRAERFGRRFVRRP